MSDSIKDGGAAFPVNQDRPYWAGMSMREYYAAMAMQAMTRSSYAGQLTADADEDIFDNIAELAFMLADAMIRAGEKTR